MVLHHRRRSARLLSLVAGAALSATSMSFAQPGPVVTDVTVWDDGEGTITVGDQTFESWADFSQSGLFQQLNARCGGPYLDADVLDQQGDPADCTYNLTNPSDDYAPSVLRFRIPVVVHVIRANNGTTGNISESLVRSQIDILNEDFLALTGTNGENGTDVQIEFFLAETDPNGVPTNGITYSNNTTWYNDSGTYYNSLAWDPDRYMNVYTNTASGALGYVPWLPQNGNVGSNADRIVCLWSAFGRNAPIGPPYNQGRTLTHEVGHYLGLFHTFDGGCSGGDCARSGDRICDTNSENSPVFGCPGSRNTCSSPDPYDNYMDYSDDLCMEKFTRDQARRMRCTLENYRPDLWLDGTLLDLDVSPLVAGQQVTFTSNGADAGETVYFAYSLVGTGSTDVPFLGVTLGIASPTLGGTAIADGGGEAIFQTTVPNGTQNTVIWFQAAQTGLVSNVVLTQIN